MKLLVTGSRIKLSDSEVEFIALCIDANCYTDLTDIVHGAAPGVDSAVAKMFRHSGIRLHPYPARWEKEGNAAGPLRNQRMLDEEHKPDDPIALVLAFPHDRSVGTWDMVVRAAKARIPVRVYPL